MKSSTHHLDAVLLKLNSEPSQSGLHPQLRRRENGQLFSHIYPGQAGKVYAIVLDFNGDLIDRNKPYPELRRTASGHLFQYKIPAVRNTQYSSCLSKSNRRRAPTIVTQCTADLAELSEEDKTLREWKRWMASNKDPAKEAIDDWRTVELRLLISALRWKQLDDNKLLGVEQLGDDEVRKLIRDIALGSK
ncbi:unnamed protein product [Alternaria alternata]